MIIDKIIYNNKDWKAYYIDITISQSQRWMFSRTIKIVQNTYLAHSKRKTYILMNFSNFSIDQGSET